MECNTACGQNKDQLKTSVQREKRASQWEVLMRKFSEAHKEECKAVTLDIPRVKRAEKTFPTGSSYTGTWDVLGMSGYGTYKFPNGVIYEGEFDDGTFHGRGELRYPSGAVIFGMWKRGEMVERTLVFPDGLPYSEENWPYCTMPDRRFTIEIDDGLEPAGNSYLTAEQPTRGIPLGLYDTGDGFYDPEAKVVLSAADLSHIIRYDIGRYELPAEVFPRNYSMRKPSAKEQQWIVENCRVNPMKPLGPRPDLYEEWSEPRTTAETMEPPGFSEPSFGISRSTIRMFNDDKDSEAEPEEKNTCIETGHSRVAMTRRLLSTLTLYDDVAVEYIEQEISKEQIRSETNRSDQIEME